jgi:two-component SAPR family response regulator
MCSEAVKTDLQEFNESLVAARRGSCAKERESDLRRAVTLYTGELLTGFYEPWVPLEQITHSQRFIGAAMDLAHIHERREEYAEAIGLAWQAVEADQLREAPYRALMQLFEASNEPASALAAYERFERVLESELGAAPSSAMRQKAQILKQRVRAPHAA